MPEEKTWADHLHICPALDANGPSGQTGWLMLQRIIRLFQFSI